MAKTYSNEAIELCRKLYCKYGGENFDGIQREMQKKFPGWHKRNLLDRGKGKETRLGWITKHGFETSLKIWTEKLVESVNDDEQDLYLGIKALRKTTQSRAIGEAATKDDVYQYIKLCSLEIDARKNLDLTRDNLETFVSGYEKLVSWLSDIDQKAARMVIK